VFQVRQHYDNQRRFDSTPIGELVLNFDCRDEIIPVLTGLQYIYTTGPLRRKLVTLVAKDMNQNSRRDVGRPGLDDWQIVVLAAVRLGLNYNYDKLQDQAENHRSLQILLGIGDWEKTTDFRARRIRDTLCQLQPSTLEAINHAVVSQGQELHGEAALSVRADSFVVETDIHYPTESTLIGDGLRKIIPLCVDLAQQIGASGWRQHEHRLKRIKQHIRTIA
jgi:IS5 family transposase